jgi:hypothetical protein
MYVLISFEPSADILQGGRLALYSIPGMASRMLSQYLRGSPCLMRFEEWMSLEGMMFTVPWNKFLMCPIHRDVTDHLQLLLRKSGHHLHTTAEREVVRIIKEKCCYIALNPSKEEKDTVGRTEEFRLPDGNIVQVSS